MPKMRIYWPPRASARRASSIVPLLCGALAALALAPGSAIASTPLGWTHTATGPATATSPLALSCASSSLCVAVGGGGEALVSANPTSSPATWSSVPVAGGKKLTSVSCPSTSECVAVDSEGEAFVSGNPGVSGSWAPVSVAAGKDLTGVSCG
ncbi:MAG: hypothetical protein ACYCU0_15995, partial [Solirubrobacteraceae bacterium]